MDIRDLAGALAPETAEQINRVRSGPTPGNIMGLPIAALRDVADVPLGMLEQAAAPVMDFKQDYPNLAGVVGGLGRVAMGLGGDPLASTKADYYRALSSQAQSGQQDQQRLAQAYAMVQQQIPNFDPNNPQHLQAALPIIGQIAGPEAMQDFAGSFDPLEKSKALMTLRSKYIADVKESSTVKGAYNNIIQSLNKGVGTKVMLTMFAKLIDPGSVVRGEETRTLEESGSQYDALRQKIENMYDKGGRLVPEILDSLRMEATNIYNNKAEETLQRTGAAREFAIQDFGYTAKAFDTRFAPGFGDALPVATGQPGDLERWEVADESDVPEEIRASTEEMAELKSPMYLKEKGTGKYAVRHRVFGNPKYPSRIRIQYLNAVGE